MKKIAILGITAGVVLGIGIIANIGLFGNNALAAQPSMEQRIKTIFWSVTNHEYGLKKIMNGMHDMKNDMNAMDQDLQQKKSFYEVEDQVTVTTFGAVTVKLVNCDDAIPTVKRAFNIETLGMRISDPIDPQTKIAVADIIVDKNYIVTTFEPQDLKQGSTGLAFTGPIGASDQVQYAYGLNLAGDDSDGIILKAVVVGQMPQGCEVTIDADGPLTQPLLEDFPDM